MKKSELIFELLKSIRMEAMETQNWGLMRAVEKAENAAMEEICGVNLTRNLPAKKLPPASVHTSRPRTYQS